jgi:serine/threonine-protein kinase
VHPKVLDFGFAKIVQPGMQLTRPDTAIGTPNFMSPEQMNAPLKVDLRSDVWALGVLLYYTLTGERPFAGRTLIATLKNVLESEVPSVRLLRPDIPPEIDEIIGRALRKRPEARYGSVREFATALLPFASEMTALVYASELAGNTVWEELDVDTNPALRVPNDVDAAHTVTEPATSHGASFADADTLIQPVSVLTSTAPPSVEPHVVTQTPEPPPRRTWLAVLGVVGLGIAAATVGALFGTAPTPQGVASDPLRATAHSLQVRDGGADAGADVRVR